MQAISKRASALRLESRSNTVMPKVAKNGLSLLVAAHAALFWLIALVDLPFGHDTFLNFQLFVQLYSGFLFESEFPLWLPYTAKGVTSDFAYIVTYLPAFYLSTLIGKLFSLADANFLFRLGLYFEEIILLVGLFKLGGSLYRNRVTPIAISVTGLLSINWATQIHWDLHNIYYLPLILFFGIRYLRGGGLEWAAYAVVVFSLGGFFYTEILLAYVLAIFGIAWLIVLRPPMRSLLRFQHHWALGLSVCVLAGGLFVLNAIFSWMSVEGMQSLATSRRVDGTIDLTDFLTYGGFITASKFAELIYGKSVSMDFHSYFGLVMLACVPLAFKRSASHEAKVFLIVAIFIALFSLGESGAVATIMYDYFPAMDRFRHIGYVPPILKIFLLVIAGLGADRLLQQDSRRQDIYFDAFRHTVFFLAAVILLYDFSANWGYPYDHEVSWLNYPEPYQNQDSDVPFWFHYSQLLFLIAFLAILSKIRSGSQHERDRLLGLIFLTTVILSMGTYKILIEWNAPAASPLFKSKWGENQNELLARPLRYIPERERAYRGVFNEASFSSTDPATHKQLQALRGWGSDNAFGYGAVQVDLCLPVARVDLVNEYLLSLRDPIRSLIGARLAGDYPEIFDGLLPFSPFESNNRMLDDRSFAAAIGCESQKLYLTHTPRFFDPEETGDVDGDGYIGRSKYLYQRPLIPTDCNGERFCGPDALSEPQITTEGIEVSHFSANRINLKVNAPEKEHNYLVYLDSYHSGWRASVDGEPAEILPANIAFKAVKLTPGEHEVMFEFTGGSKWTQLTIWTNFVITIVGSIVLVFMGILRIMRSLGRLTRATRVGT